jgi:hypothetical protein
MLTVQILLDEAQYGFEQGLAGIVVLVHQRPTDYRVGTIQRHGDGPVIGVEKSEQSASRDDLIVVDDLTVISPIDLTELPVGLLDDA